MRRVACWRSQSSGWIPQRTRGLSIPIRVALLLAGGQRVDDVERSLSPARRARAGTAPRRSARRCAPRFRAAPGSPRSRSSGRRRRARARSRAPHPTSSCGGDLVADASVTPRLIPDAGVVDESGADVLAAGRPGEDEGLVTEVVERRAKLAGDHALSAIEPVGADPDPHRTQPRAASAAGARERLAAGDGGAAPGLGEDELAVAGVDADHVALGELALEQLQGELVDQLALDHPLQRPGAVGRVVAEVAEQRAGVVGELDLDPALAHAPGEQLDLELDDPADVLAAEPVEDHGVVDPVEELGLEGRRRAPPRSARGSPRRPSRR